MGTYFHNMDVKGRMNFPVKIREIIGDLFVITKGLDGCLFVYSSDEFQKLVAKINDLPLSKSRNMKRFFLSGAVELEVDKLGRIVIPQHLREHANLLKETVVIGASDKAEIWAKENWDKFNEDFSENDMLDAMDEIGF